MWRHARLVRVTLGLALTLAAVKTVGGRQCAGCRLAEYWPVTESTTRSDFPEDGQIPAAKQDFGVAFSGGGTRSAAATVGELRGLAENKWLDDVGYITAVSGGSWAAVPFTFSRFSTEEILGGFVAGEDRYVRPGDLSLDTIDEARGLLPAAIAQSSLTIPGIVEGLDIARTNLERSESTSTVATGARELLAREIVGESVSGLLTTFRKFFHGPESERRDKTYARLLQHAFLRNIVPGSENRPFAWNRRQVADIGVNNRGQNLGASTFVTANVNRPFLIVGGSIIKMRADSVYPALIPVEYTPLYTGVRARFGKDLGGSYVWSWAYDGIESGTQSTGGQGNQTRHFVEIGTKGQARTFSLADLIASSGAAPQLALVTHAIPALPASVDKQGAEAFPSFSHIAIQRPSTPATDNAGVRDTAKDSIGEPVYLPHGDGGFTDNLGLMPLLVRQVHNVILFINSNVDPENNEQLQSYFMALGQSNSSGDRSINEVFPADAWAPLIDDLMTEADRGHASVVCRSGWKVKSNEVYDIRAYDDLNICFVYNQLATEWKNALPSVVRAELFPDGPSTKHAKHFKNFPHYDTFGQNKPKLIQLHADQVNVLANFTSWMLTNRRTKDEILKHLGRVIAQQ